MASKKGRQVRKNRPAPKLEEIEGFKAPFVPCLKCGIPFMASNRLGSFGKRYCSSCGARVTEGRFRARAMKAISDKRKRQEQIDAIDGELAQAQRRVDRFSVWYLRPLRPFARRRQRRVEERLAPQKKAVQDAIAALEQDIARYERSGYYLSEWFLNTHYLLEEDGGLPLEVHYSPSGELRLEVKGKAVDAAGLPAEYRTFNCFLTERDEESSPLHGCRPVPNLFIPIPADKRRGRALWSQIDLVILTRSCVFVVEVKNWRNDIYVERETGQIYVTRGAGGGGQEKEIDGMMYCRAKSTLDQNSDHALWFHEMFDAYPFDRVYEVTAFYRPESFGSDFDGFDNNIFAGTLGGVRERQGNGETAGHDVVEVMRRETARLKPLFKQKEVERMADTLLRKYGDLNQKRRIMHARMLS